MMRSLRTIFVAGSFALVVAFALPEAHAGIPVPPLGFGPFTIACSNVEQDFSRLKPGELVEQYWEGIPAGNGTRRYVTDLLVAPANTATLTFGVPDDAELYGDFAGKPFVATLLICYPTSASNPRADYPLPNGRVVPRMQRGGEQPLFPDLERRPVLLFSHGLAGSPLSNDYIRAVSLFASYGYVAVAPFHGDARAADIKLEDVNDGVWALLHFRDYISMQALRPLTLKVALDFVLKDSAWRDHVDPARVAGFGASLGGESLLLQAGAKMTTTVGFSSKQVLVDERLKAIVGYVPYFGQVIFPAFGRDQTGIDFMNPVPVLSISGTADTTAPLPLVEQGMKRMQSTRILVTLEGVGHYFDEASVGDIFTWSLDFLAATTTRDTEALATLQTMSNVEGGGDDRIRLDYVEPYAPIANEADAIEYRNDSLGHYFVTTEPAEAAMLDAGIVVPGWKRTGYNFKAWTPGSPFGQATCRFFGTPGIGPNSHFFTVNADECAKVQANPMWTFEGYAFQVRPPVGIACSGASMLVTRLYNNGQGGQASHRYTTSPSVRADMLSQGWIEEGPVFCTPP
jgi:hypothetical protein